MAIDLATSELDARHHKVVSLVFFLTFLPTTCNAAPLLQGKGRLCKSIGKSGRTSS